VSAPVVDLERSVVTLGGRRLVVHCSHYNAFLQRTVEDALGPRAPSLLVAAAMESTRVLLEGLFAESPAGSPEDAIARAAEAFSAQGFGLLDLGEFGPRGGRATLTSSHYALGWLARWGARSSPGCFFAAGYLAGMLAAASRLSPERITSREVECLAAGAPRCSFVVEVW